MRAVTRLLVPTALSLSVSSIAGAADTPFASRAPEQGALPAIVNASLLVDLCIRPTGRAVGQAAFPQLAADVAAGAAEQYRRTTARITAVVIVLALPAAAGPIILGQPVVHLLFCTAHTTRPQVRWRQRLLPHMPSVCQPTRRRRS